MRDRFALTRNQLLRDYRRISENRPEAAAATALRTESLQFRDVLANQASGGRMDYEQLKEHVLTSAEEDYNFGKKESFALAELGRICLLQRIEKDDVAFGEVAISLACKHLPSDISTRKHRRTLLQHYIATGQENLAYKQLDEQNDLDREFHQYLRAELKNPFAGRNYPDFGFWLKSFNARLKRDKLETVSIDTNAETAFDGLHCETEKVGAVFNADNPAVTVVMTTYCPNRSGLLTSVKSILNQSLKNIELIIVDDSSPTEYQPLLKEVSESDPRIRLLSTRQNSGTYVARNIGYAAARAELIAGQDDDDWSHPRRLEKQVAALTANPDWAGCTVRSITCTPELSRVRTGYDPFRYNSSSLMMRGSDFKELGGFLPIRKAADTELRLRLERYTGKIVHEISEPLTFVRIMSDSLSRSEFKVGWQHPARQRFRSSYEHWHATAQKADLRLDHSSRLPVAVPRRFLIDPDNFPRQIEVVLAGDWRSYGGPQKSMIEEITALTRAGIKVGVLHLEAARFMTRKMDSLCAPIQELINSGAVQEVLYDDPVQVDLLVLRYPPILQFMPHQPTAMKVRRMLILANQAPSGLNGKDVRYLVQEVHQNASDKLCPNVMWVPQGPQVRKAIEPYLRPEQMTSFDLPGILDHSEWKNYRTGPRGIMPVIGKHSRDDKMKWPDDEEALSLVYPVDGSMDVRVMGGARTIRRMRKVDADPVGWTVFEKDEIPVKKFLRMLDFFVFYQHSSAVEAFGRSILEALASSVVVVLPPHYEEVFGEAAIYAEPNQVQRTLERLHDDWPAYSRQLEKAEKVVKTFFSYESYVARIREILYEQIESKGVPIA